MVIPANLETKLSELAVGPRRVQEPGILSTSVTYLGAVHEKMSKT